MVELTSRCLSFAEAVVTMVCPVLLALDLKKDKWMNKVQESILPTVMLVVAGASLVASILPILACSISERFHTENVKWPSVTRVLAASISSACLLVLACWISSMSNVSESWVIVVGSCLGIFLVSRSVSYWFPDGEGRSEEATPQKELRLRGIVDKSHEFLSGVTGILFLGLEGMALEGLLSTYYLGKEQNALELHMTITFCLCAAGVTLMFLQMVPPRTAALMNVVVYVTDVTMAFGIWALLTTIMQTLRAKYVFLFWFFPFMIFLHLVYRVALQTRENTAGEDSQGEAEPKPAPMGLTKVTFTGFLAVSVRAISGGSPGDYTISFLVFAAAAIASGVSWRLLTHKHNKDRVGGEAAADEAANVASFCTHFCVAIATVLFAVMAWKAVSAQEDIGAACAHVHDVTCVHLNRILDVHHMRNMCSCIDPCRN
uniref:Uncharacterized protein n=1 Tax=Avena sativa TaxID=4498 RepID=A0ACD5YIU2_AVESA